MERQWLLLSSVTPPVVPRHGCGIPWDLQQTTPNLVQQLPEASCVPVEQGPEGVWPEDWHPGHGGCLLSQALHRQGWVMWHPFKQESKTQLDCMSTEGWIWNGGVERAERFSDKVIVFYFSGEALSSYSNCTTSTEVDILVAEEAILYALQCCLSEFQCKSMSSPNEPPRCVNNLLDTSCRPTSWNWGPYT